MKKIFISHPFTGAEKENREDAARISRQLQEKKPDAQIMNPLELFRCMDGNCDEPVILAACMDAIDKCDLVILCDGWEKSAGCKAEASFAIWRGVPCLDMQSIGELLPDDDGCLQ